jgi:cobalt-zinc-cadmium resistance protein CzcA
MVNSLQRRSGSGGGSTKLPGISLESAIATQTMVEKTLKKFPEVRTVVTLGGSSEIPTDPMGVEQSDTFIILKPKSEWRTAQTEAGLIEAYKQALEQSVPGNGRPARFRLRSM